MSAKIKSEKGSYTLEEGRGTVLVTRVMTDGQSHGNIQEFTYNGNSTQAIVQAIQMARGEIDIELAKAAAVAKAAAAKAATPSAPAPKPKQESTDESEDADESEGSDDETEEPAAEDSWQQPSLL